MGLTGTDTYVNGCILWLTAFAIFLVIMAVSLKTKLDRFNGKLGPCYGQALGSSPSLAEL